MSTLDQSQTPPHDRQSYAWASRGDVNAFFGLMLDNIGDMILMAGLLIELHGFPREFVLTRMIPGTAVGVLVGDLIFTAMAFRLARRTGRADVTAMPLGLDTPSTFGSVFLILAPSFHRAVAERGMSVDDAARHAWFVGIAMLMASGVFKLACATGSGWIRRSVPRAGLLGSLTAIALVLISFLPLLDIVRAPVAGITAMAIVLVALTARWKLPGNVPGALAALVIGGGAYYLTYALGYGPGPGGGEMGRPALALRAVLPMPVVPWYEWLLASWREAAEFLPVAIPLALATVVGGIDCSESASAAGDDYPTGQIIAGEGVATLVAGLFGGVIQSTPYIGHPAYKAMGARAGYTLATALFVGAAGVFGFFDWIFYLIPRPVVFPILVFVGLEITAQSFRATAPRHLPAVAIACLPALAYLGKLLVEQILPEAKPFAEMGPIARHLVQSITMLSGGFIVTSLLWGAILSFAIDGRIRAAFFGLILASGCSIFGVIHSPLPSGPIATPGEVSRELAKLGRLETTGDQTPYHWAAGYAAAAVLLLALGRWGSPPDRPELDESGPADLDRA